MHYETHSGGGGGGSTQVYCLQHDVCHDKIDWVTYIYVFLYLLKISTKPHCITHSYICGQTNFLYASELRSSYK